MAGDTNRNIRKAPTIVSLSSGNLFATSCCACEKISRKELSY